MATRLPSRLALTSTSARLPHRTLLFPRLQPIPSFGARNSVPPTMLLSGGLYGFSLNISGNLWALTLLMLISDSLLYTRVALAL